MNHTAKALFKEKMQFKVEQPGGSISLDADEVVGGENGGLRPKPMMLSALLGCTGMDVESLLKKMRVDIDKFELDADGEMTDAHPKFYKKVHVTYSFHGNEMNRKKIEKAVDLSVNRYCGVYEMFRHFAEVSHEIKFFEN